ncbi:hypothetical protein J3F84DRAFT_284548 [Trichoderma pleuroticola]
MYLVFASISNDRRQCSSPTIAYNMRWTSLSRRPYPAYRRPSPPLQSRRAAQPQEVIVTCPNRNLFQSTPPRKFVSGYSHSRDISCRCQKTSLRLQKEIININSNKGNREAPPRLRKPLLTHCAQLSEPFSSSNLVHENASIAKVQIDGTCYIWRCLLLSAKLSLNIRTASFIPPPPISPILHIVHTLHGWYRKLSKTQESS